jgi:hypothetical protein
LRLRRQPLSLPWPEIHNGSYFLRAIAKRLDSTGQIVASAVLASAPVNSKSGNGSSVRRVGGKKLLTLGLLYVPCRLPPGDRLPHRGRGSENGKNHLTDLTKLTILTELTAFLTTI